MDMQKWIIALLSLSIFFVTSLSAQVSSTKEWKEKYQERIQKEYLFGVYIPKDFADAFSEFNRLIEEDSRKKFKEVSEKEAVKKLHFSFGRWIIYNWQFYEGSRFSHYLRQLGVYHPDDMARVVIRSYHRYLNKKDIDIKEQVKAIEARKERERQEKQRRLDSLAQQQRETLTPRGKN